MIATARSRATKSWTLNVRLVANMALRTIILLLALFVNRTGVRAFVACLLLLGIAACSQPQCLSQYGYAHRPRGYHWRAAKAPGTHNVVYYGIDPSDGRTVYVGPDGQYYAYRHAGFIRASDLRSAWCAHAVGESRFTRSQIDVMLSSLSVIFAHRDRLVTYGYVHRPRGYGWKPRRSKTTGAIAYYGIDPANGWTVYVGPDNLYYTFPHRGDIQPADLDSTWDPHDALPR